jgi:hypothetical protein
MLITDARLDELAHVGDAPVDDVIRRHAAEMAHLGPRDLVAGIARHLVLPPEQRSPAIREYLEDQQALPEWHDPALLARSADFFARTGLEIGGALFWASLPQAYAGHRGARVLTLTGRMVTDLVRRVTETAQFLVDVTSPGGLLPGSRGYADIRRVRLMHGAVRYLVLEDPSVVKTDDPAAGLDSWSPAQGLPVNQEDLLGTLLTFTTVTLAALRRQGIGYDQADAEAYMHAWCVVGHFLGIQPDLLPMALEDAQDLQSRMFPRLQGPSGDALLLGRALATNLGQSLDWRPLRGLPGSLITYFVGREIAAINGVHSDWTRLAFGPSHFILGLVGQAERHDALVKDVADRVTAAVLADFLRRNPQGRPPFVMPRQLHSRVVDLQSAWRL